MIKKGIFFFFLSSLVFGQMMGSGGVGMVFNLPVQDLSLQESSQTSAMRVNPFQGFGDWYRGAREIEVPELEWELNRANSEGMTFQEAEVYAASRAAEGWRLPTIWELEALYQQQEVLAGDLSDDMYEDVMTGAFWSETEIRSGHYYMYIKFGLECDGEDRIDNCYVGLRLRVRLVRDVR